MRRITCALSILTFLLGAGAAFGQAQKGTITVTITDDSGARLPGATVEAASDQTLTRRTAITDETGVASLVALDPAGNYVVTVTLDGFNGARFESVQVRAGQGTALEAQLGLATVTEELVVTAEAPIVDVTSSVTGQEITLQLTESLPTARSYQDYLQLVPGVMPAVDQGQGDNPASRSGLNYRDLLGEVGQSRDNYYYLEGINVTDGASGLSRTNLNTEIIQEQSVLTGGLPAEFVGASGLVSNVITKSGGNAFTGSINYYIQNDSLVESNDHFEDAAFDTTDAAVTFGGPIVRDKAWFFASFRNVNRKDDVVDSQGTFLRSVEDDQDQGFFKLSWAPTSRDLVTVVGLSDPRDISGQRDPNLQPTRDFAQSQGGERVMVNYSRVFKSASFELGFADHSGDLDEVSFIAAPWNEVTFRAGDPFTPDVDQQLGGQGDLDTETRGTQNLRFSLEYFFQAGGDHSLKLGADLAEYSDFRDANYISSDGTSRYTSLDSRYVGQNVTNEDVINNIWTAVDFDASNPSDWGGFMDSFALMSAGDQAAIVAAYDGNGDGVLEQQEFFENLVFGSTSGNPNGMINYGRRAQIAPGAATTFSEGTTFFVQDLWQSGRWSVNAGFRTEEWEHFASTGQSVFTFDTEIAPRFSIAYDLKGDGRSRLSLYYGRYYDPIRNNATNFVGSLTTRILEEQVYIGAVNDWVSFRTRGGVGQLDATFAPTTQTPYTDEIQIGYKSDIGRNMSIEVNVIKRETRDIIEDYDFGLYAGDDYPGDPNDADSLFLGPDFFGFPTTPTSNFNIATLPPGNARDWDGLEVIFRKRYSDNWQILSSYSYADADGNTSSDSNFDFAGDVLWLDPRAPNLQATLPGLIEHLFKIAGSYNFDNGFQLGGTYRWNSGAIVNNTFLAFRRHLPARVDVADAFDFAGINSRWVSPNSVGQLDMPSYGLLDLRAAYLWNIGDRFQADFFFDIFNVIDDQKAVQIQDLLAEPDYKEGVNFVPPRRFFLGARLRF